MHANKIPGGVQPMMSDWVRRVLAGYDQLCQSDERDEPIEETVERFAARIGWPVGSTVTVVEWCWERDLLDIEGGMGEHITAATVIEGRYRS